MTTKDDFFDNENFKKDWLDHYTKNSKEVDDLYQSVMTHVDELLTLNHETIGRVLKCHLAIELYINKYLEFELNINPKNKMNLRFIQKVELIENIKPSLKPYLVGIREINSVRNKLAHNLNPALDPKLLPMTVQLSEWMNSKSDKPRQNCELIDYIEIYTKSACTAIAEKSTPLGKRIEKEMEDLIKKYSKHKSADN
jgi:hypothetical protein